MKRFKKGLSWLITLCMLLTMTPGVFAVEDVDVTETAPAETSVTAPGDDTDVSGVQAEKAEETEPEESETVSEKPVENKTVKAKAKKTAKQPAALAEEESEPAAQAITMGTKPNDGTTSGQPFAGGTGGSNNFRIPALVTLNDGTLVAATDARWNTTVDGGGLDTIVSRSTNGGATWRYTFANYLGDNGNEWNGASTAFIDPALATDGTNVYMLVDLFPAGYALNGAKNTPVAGANGFTDEGYLRLSDNGRSSYGFYLKDGKIYRNSGTEVSGYSVDEKFNITGKNCNTNLFCSDSPYQVYPTNYLYLTKSSDGGASWSAPTLINVKEANEQTYLVGPGRGLVTSDGTIMFAGYEYTSGTQNASFIYSKDGGKTWGRTADVSKATRDGNAYTGWSSEAQLTELSDGTIRMFFRNGWNLVYYADAVQSGTGYDWTTFASGPKFYSNCQISAITYSKLIDGKKAVLVSCPTNSTASENAEGRKIGKIYVGLVNDDNTLDWKYTYQVTSGAYAYSCLTELSDGSIGLLYEPGETSGIKYASFDIEKIASGAVIGGEQTETDKTVTDEATGISVKAAGLTGVTVADANVAVSSVKDAVKVKAYDITPMADHEKYIGEGTVSIPVPENWNTKQVHAFIVEDNNSVKTIEGKLEGNAYTFTAPHFSVMGLAETKSVVDVTTYVGQTKTIIDESGAYAANGVGSPNTSVATVTAKDTTFEVAGAVTKVTSITSGKRYLIANSRANLILTDDTKDTGLLLDGAVSAGSEELWTIKQVSGGYTIQNAAGKYLTIGNGTAALSDSAVTLSAEYVTSFNDYYGTLVKLNAFEIGLGHYYLNQSGGHTSTKAAGYYYLDAGSGWNIYEVTDTQNAPATEITFTGVAPGTTTAVVGGTTYNITVKEVPEVLDTESTPFTANTGIGASKPVTKLTTSVGVRFDLNVTGENVTWSIDDTSIATVDQKGVVTGKAEGSTYVSAVVDGVIYKIPVTVLAGNGSDGTADNDKLVNVYVSGIKDSNVYCNVGNDTNLVEVQEGEAFYISYANSTQISFDFFAAPHSGYALTQMSATNSQGQYLALQDKTDPTGCDFYNPIIIIDDYGNEEEKDHAGTNQRAQRSDAFVSTLISNATGKSPSCDGALGFTRKTTETNDINSDLTFRSEKLPEITKEVVAIREQNGGTLTGRPYEKGMTAKVGEEVFFRVTVTKEAYQANNLIDFTDIISKDLLAGVTLYEDAANYPKMTGNSVNYGTAFDTVDAVTKTYYVGYVIQEKDIDTTITNTVDLSYQYKSQYSTGTFSETAEAKASITATAFAVKDIVVDFGLPVDIVYSASELAGTYSLAAGTYQGTYGTAEVSGNTITYTPDKVLAGKDVVTIQVKKQGKTLDIPFSVYPATTVYYEEGFAVEGASKGTGTQTCSEVDSDAHYGFDSKYAGEAAGASNNTQATHDVAAFGTFANYIFTGTGTTIYTNNEPNSGSVMAQIKDSRGATKKLITVDTAMRAGTSSATAGQEVNGYNVPIIDIVDLGARDTYTVKINHVKGDQNEQPGAQPVSLDGFRVYNTLDQNSEVYQKDGEANPSYVELRNKVLTGLNVDAGTSQYANQISKDVMAQVYATGDTSGAVVLDSSSNPYTNGDVQDLLDNGPKNELYLFKGQSVVFKLTNDAQIGLKALNAATSYRINNGTAQTLKTSTDMFYKQAAGNVTITNNGSGILSITKIKTTGGTAAAAAFAELTADDLVPALLSMGYEEEPAAEYADAVLNISVTDKKGKALASTELTKNGVKGETATFTADEIETAVSGLTLPKGYKLNKASFSDEQVAYGETGDAVFRAVKGGSANKNNKKNR